MAKFKVSFKNSQITVKSKLDKSELINQKEINVFNSKFIRGLMRPKVNGSKKIEYLAPGNATLFSYLQSGLSKNDFFVVFAQFIECLKKIERNSFNVNNLVLNTKYIFFNNITKEVQFIYQPIINSSISSVNVFSFIYELASSTVLNLEENNAFLNDLTGYVRSLKIFSPIAMEKYILKVYPEVYKKVRRSKTGDSQSLKNTGWNYYDEKYKSSGKGTDVTEEDEETGLLEEDETSLLYETDDDSEGTTVLDNDEGTALLTDEEISYPYLIRVNTYEKVNIDKSVFRIGKEKSYVDYFVMNNNAVSRIHADISTKDDSYFIKDNNSTNHTFVNGTMIPANQNVQIFDGDSIMLANEPFEFHVF